MTADFPPGSESIRLTHSSRDGDLTVRGGVGGISVQLEELGTGARRIDDLAGDLLKAETEIGRVLDDLCLLDHQPPWSNAQHVVAVRESHTQLRAVRTGMQEIAASVRACIRDYSEAEHWAAEGRRVGINWSRDAVPSLEVMTKAGAVDRWTMESIIVGLGLRAPEMQEVIDKAPYARDLGMKLFAGNAVPRPISVRQEESLQVDLDTSPAGLLEQVRLIDARGPGCVEVIEVDNGGQKTFVVVLPGTQAAGKNAGRSNPFDEAGIAEGMLYDSEQINAAVLQALAAAGAEKGAPVVAVGYSQGGIHAMNFASDPRVGQEYDVKYVLTAGSPVAGISVDAQISTLHLEHQADWVPGADGAANPETRNRVTVSINTPLREVEGEGALGLGHGLTGYQESARLVTASSDPSLVQSTAALGGVLGAGGVATATRYSLTRAKAPTALVPRDARTQELHRGGR
ncbi:hypothetical protein [Pseudarthrobacter sp. fls2-241-R2A-127]|uniref:hypothetical protein n=1 Tax=Pseudarthrobacter sp. fls2-241-R2A-127 TaxID=3040303 RepID=UPI0025528766|nr:hypothetical protein [Pseudarthrobacter sp. fls2-241-R2A-127]